jgi:phosphatidylserine/phosphatidylglycerophosphate/cardiolipin synthase-like enzyme
LASALALGLIASPLRGQNSAPPHQVAQTVASMGQPSRWQPHVAAAVVLDPGGSGTAGSIALGAQHPVLSPALGLLGFAGEAYAGVGASHPGAGARVLATVPLLGLGAGADWNVAEQRPARVDALLSFQMALRRGGLLGHGSMLRLDWLPARSGTLALGVTVPLQSRAGCTRPRDTSVRLADPPASRGRGGVTACPEADSALAIVQASAGLIAAYVSVFSHRDVDTLLAASERGGDARYDATMAAYGSALERAFTLAAGDSVAGAAITRRARAVLLDDVIIAYDSTFGEAKRASGIGGLAASAQAHFAQYVRDSTLLPAPRADAAIGVHRRWLDGVERTYARLLSARKDSRLVWLPFQLALAPDAFDEQAELDSLIARVVGRPFSDQNALAYLNSSDLPLEIARSIYAARDYHVLWTHDFAGRRKSGTVDHLAYDMVADVYFPALTAAVARYDSTGHLPIYMILLDQFYYDPTDGRLWMTMLENPLRARMRLPGHESEREAHLRARQQALCDAVAHSSRLQADALAAGGKRWIERVVKVHVSITHPSDGSFRSGRIVPPIPITPDNISRDHRKIVFYDLTEADPFRGAMILMGIGIGEHYASASWEDRGFRIRGPAALAARDATRRLLSQNGFRADYIPVPLRRIEGAPSDSATERRMNRGDYVGRALQVHNETGFGRKDASIARAMLYTLTPTGSVIIAPDPLWLDETWAAMLAGAAARGNRVCIVAPAKANAPSPAGLVLALEHDVLVRLLEIRRRLAAPMRRSGGDLRIGLYVARAPLTDVQARAREVRAGLDRAPWIREIFPFDSTTLGVLDRAAAQTAGGGGDATSIAHDEKARATQLHQKTQLIARPGAMAALLRQPGWDDALGRSMRVQSQQTGRFADQLVWTTPEVDSQATRKSDVMLRGYEQTIPEAERKRLSFYFTLGTQNQDSRSTVLDGEATLIVSGLHAAAGVVDMYYLMTRSEWITSEAELDRLVPPSKGLTRWLSRALRIAL